MPEIVSQLSAQLTTLFGSYIPNLVGAMAILVLGWLLALIVASLVRGGLRRSTVDARIAEVMFPGEPAKAGDVQRWTGRVVFFLIMLFVLIAVFQTLQLAQVIEPINQLLTVVFQFVPRLLSGGLLLGIAWIIATVLRVVIVRGLIAARLDERLADHVGAAVPGATPLAKSLAEAIYWLIFLLFFPAVLGALAVNGLLVPVKAMVSTILGVLPKVFAAGLILLIGWFLARIAQRIVASLLVVVGLDRLSERVGLTNVLGAQHLSGVVGLLVYILILIPALIAALNALEMGAITQPASEMLATILGAIPNVLGAGLILALAYMVGRVISALVANLLAGVGFDTGLARIGLARSAASSATAPSAVVGVLILVAIMLFASIAAAGLLGFQVLADLVAQFTVFGGHLIVGLIVFGIGLYLANVAATAVASSGAAPAGLLAKGARAAILVLATAMALRQMGLADEIVNLAFGLLLGAFAVAFALALGLGGRDIAAAELRAWWETMKSKRT